MISLDLTAHLRHYFDKYGDVPLRCKHNGWTSYVEPLAVRGKDLIVLQRSTKRKCLVENINFLVQSWESALGEVQIFSTDGRMYSITSIGLETKNWDNVPNWELSIILDVQPFKTAQE
jgi:hypothetical protein